MKLPIIKPLLIGLGLLFLSTAFAQTNGGPPASGATVKLPMKYYGVSPPLSQLARNPIVVSPENGQLFEDEMEKLIEVPGPPTPGLAPVAPFVQTATPKPFSAVAGASFEGPGKGLAGFMVTGAPPDTTMAVGPRHVVAWVNSQYVVYNKVGAMLLPPVNGNSLFVGLGNVCETTNRGDPILQYDRLANRWVLSQFAFTSQTVAPWLQCIAISTTDDPTGTYVRYTIDFGAVGFNDYGKLGVWPDAYYTSYNIFSSPTSLIVALCASDRVKMLAGDPTATTLCATSTNFGGGAAFLPADLDGTTLPSDLTQGGIFIRQSTAPALRYLKLKPNFTAGTVTATDGFGGANGSFVALSVAVTRACNGAGDACVAQPTTTNKLDTLGDRLMYRLAFRNRAGVESMLVTQAEDPDGAGTRSSAIRWYEIRNPLGNPTDPVVAKRPVLFQNATYDPGASGDRWMGSMAMDKYGNILAGYSVVNAGTGLKPSIAVAGRLAGDAVNTLQAESIAVNGTGVQTGTLTRWGDYSTMQIDPADDSTFWFTTEYLAVDGTFNWRTRIVSYRFQVPVAITLPASSVSLTGATLNGTVNASGINSAVSFEYGLTSAYGSSIAATPATATGSAVTAVSAGLTGLTPRTTYHFRVVATNTEGTDKGADQTFFTNDLGLQAGSITLPAITDVLANDATRVRFAQVFGSIPVVVVQPTNEDPDPQALRIVNVTTQGFDVLQVEAPGGAGCVGCTGKGLGMTVNWLAAIPGTYRLPNIVPGMDLRVGAQPNAPGTGVIVKVGRISTSDNQRSTTAGGFAGWPATSWQAVTYPAGENFSAAPIVLTTIQTWSATNEGADLNLAGATPALTGVPEPWATAVSRNVTATGFDVALESSEVDKDDTGAAGFDVAETIGFIAIESGVSLQLKQNDGAVVGLATGLGSATDACTAVDLLFPSGTPLVAANLRGFAGKQSRTLDDGGWLRRCVLSSPGANMVRMTMQVDEDDDLDVDRTHATAETIGTAIFGGDFTTTPISLARVSSARSANSLNVRFSTAVEVGHLGYRIWGRENAQSDWQALHSDLIVSQGADGMAGRSYERTVNGERINEIRIEDIDILGRSRFHPTIAVGTQVGAEAINSPLDWNAIRASNSSTAVRALGRGANAVVAEVKRQGIQRIRYEDMLTAGWLAAPIPKARVAVTDNGREVLRHILCAQAGSEFGPGCSVEWLGNTHDSIYGNSNFYKISDDLANAQPVNEGALVDVGNQTLSFNSEVKVAPNIGYSFSAPGNDPWYDARMVASTVPVEINRTFALPERVDGPVSIAVTLWGGLDFAGDSADHSVEIRVNGQSLATRRFDGLREEVITLNLPSNLLQSSNTLTVRVLADTGYAADVVLLDGFAVRYTRASRVVGGELALGQVASAMPASSDVFANSFESRDGFQITGVAAPSVVWSQSGTRVRRDEISGDRLLDSTTTAFVVADIAHIATPNLSPAIDSTLNTSQVDYLIVTHPLFEAELTALVQMQQSRGYSVRVLRTDAIFAAKSDFEHSPQAIRQAIAQINPRFVLLVGGDTYDYNNYLGLGSQSYVPTFYRVADPIVRFAATDALFVDADGDGKPDRALGRIPARTVAELRLALDSIIQRAATPAIRYLGVGGGSNASEQFDTHSRSLLSYLRQGQPKDFALTDELGIANARSKAIAGLAGSADWINYLGHSSPNRWAAQNLLDTSQLASITRTGVPAIVSQWGCWNNYFVLPDQDTMSHALMLRPNHLAAAVIGSTSLAEDASHLALATRLFDLVEDGVFGETTMAPINTLGEALMAAKRNLAEQAPQHVESNYSITLFGDPAQPLR